MRVPSKIHKLFINFIIQSFNLLSFNDLESDSLLFQIKIILLSHYIIKL